MEALSSDAAEALDIIENELETGGDDADEADAVRHSSDVSEESDLDEEDSDRDASKPYDVPSPAFKEQSEKVLHAMVSKLMDALETYDSVLEDMGLESADDGDSDHEVHVHTKANRVHIHHGDDDSDSAGDHDADDSEGHDMAAHDGADADDGADDGSADDGSGAGDDSADDGSGKIIKSQRQSRHKQVPSSTPVISVSPVMCSHIMAFRIISIMIASGVAIVITMMNVNAISFVMNVNLMVAIAIICALKSHVF